MKNNRYLISGGGTGGHIFPAISIANELKAIDPTCEILFIGAEGRMEMERVPAAGYEIKALRIEGFNRKNMLKNISVLWHLFTAIIKARKIINQFKPDVAIGVGGYVSGAAMKVAQQMGIPVLLQEQNGFAGVTNKLLAKKAAAICVAFPNMERFFPADKIVMTGTPVRQALANEAITKEEGCNEFGVDINKPTLLVIGGSLGAATLNSALLNGLEKIKEANINLIWQTGKYYYDKIIEATANIDLGENIKIMPFVSRMDLAYKTADVVISRAGASSIAELSMLSKATILVPSPNVAEDHQTHNAKALSDNDAALFCADKEAENELVNMALSLIKDDEKCELLRKNICSFAHPNAAADIAQKVIQLVK